ncbi:MAG TPA: hypothetical protein IAA05_02610, partial [Candidatus Blautia excrementipullorum]|nr:hypothetical protein [Candidatus Blautia excrementipullorum]
SVPAGLIKVPLFSVLPFQNSQKNGRLVLGEDISIFSMQFAETQEHIPFASVFIMLTFFAVGESSPFFPPANIIKC